MSTPPIPMAFDGDGAFRILPNFLRMAREHYGAGEVVPMVPREDRSPITHKHFFACVNTAWQNLPEELAERFKSADHLRKFALIQTGHRDETVYACMFKTEARRLAASLAPLDDYAVVVIDGTTVTRLTAKSQSYFNMKRQEFAQAKTDVLAYLEAMIGVEPGELGRQREAA